jgi:ketosteroid isomerase-like protein
MFSISLFLGLNFGTTGEKENLLDIDREFSKSASAKGLSQAILEVLSEDGVMLPRDGHPVMGKEAFKELTLMIPRMDLDKLSQWEPLRVGMAAAGDLGYTFGRYVLPGSEPNEGKAKSYGYYASLWKKKKDGTWKIVFNRGLLLIKFPNEKPPDLNSTRSLGEEKQTLVRTELAFSDFAGKNGIPSAFYNFIAEDGIALSSTGPPNTKDTFRKQMDRENKSPSKTRLEWKPIFTEVSESGDIGYNFGPFKYTAVNAEGKEQFLFGYFMTIWKKRPDGSWRFVFDGGNQCSSYKDW